MSDAQYYSIEEPNAPRRDILQAHLWTLELQKKQDAFDKLSTRKTAQYKKLRISMNNIKKALEQFTTQLPTTPERTEEPVKKQERTYVKKEPVIEDIPEMTELEKEIEALKKKIEQL